MSIVGGTATKNDPAFVHAEGIGMANAQTEEALKRERAGEVVDTSPAVSFSTDESEGDHEDAEDDPGELTQEDIDAGEFEDDPDKPQH